MNKLISIIEKLKDTHELTLSEYEYLILGSTNLDDVNDALDLEFESDDYDTIGGYCLQLLDHLPEENETLSKAEQYRKAELPTLLICVRSMLSSAVQERKVYSSITVSDAGSAISVSTEQPANA